MNNKFRKHLIETYGEKHGTLAIANMEKTEREREEKRLSDNLKLISLKRKYFLNKIQRDASMRKIFNKKTADSDTENMKSNVWLSEENKMIDQLNDTPKFNLSRFLKETLGIENTKKALSELPVVYTFVKKKKVGKLYRALVTINEIDMSIKYGIHQFADFTYRIYGNNIFNYDVALNKMIKEGADDFAYLNMSELFKHQEDLRDILFTSQGKAGDYSNNIFYYL